jgi:hypothetical protein
MLGHCVADRYPMDLNSGSGGVERIYILLFVDAQEVLTVITNARLVILGTVSSAGVNISPWIINDETGHGESNSRSEISTVIVFPSGSVFSNSLISGFDVSSWRDFPKQDRLGFVGVGGVAVIVLHRFLVGAGGVSGVDENELTVWFLGVVGTNKVFLSTSVLPTSAWWVFSLRVLCPTPISW